MLGLMRLYALGLVLVAALSTAACGSSPGTIGPTGVDELTIPTPSPRPADFVDRIDNRWLPLAAGARWTYAVERDGRTGTATVRVTGESPLIAGVATTELEAVVTEGGREVRRTVQWFAQDRSGNVWLLGASTRYDDGSGRAPIRWRAGEAGAQAGVAMLGAPRVGDGYAQELASGVAEDRARIVSVTEALDTVAGPQAAGVLIRVTTPLEPGSLVQQWYAPGVGLVRQTRASGESLTLTGYRPG
jgi:hypothetical protein